MEYYHLHTKGNQDKFWRESREFTVDNKWHNRLYKRCTNFSLSASTSDFQKLTAIINYCLNAHGFSEYTDKILIGDMLEKEFFNIADPKTKEKLLELARKAMFDAVVFKREMALENYRLENASNLPSRLHSLYVTTEEGLSYWCNLLIDNDLEVFKVDVANEPFVTNEQFLPSEELTYQESYNLSKNYWYPKFNKQNIDTASNEYLVQGRVRILKKVDEIKKK